MSETSELLTAIAETRFDDARAIVASRPAQAAARNDQGVSALMLAAYYQQPDLARAIAEVLPEVDLFEAAILGDQTEVARCVDAGESLEARSADGFTPLHLACFFGQRDLVTWLLAQSSSVNAVATNPSAVRPIHSAAARNDELIVRQLLQAGADPDAAQQGGWTALHSAAKRGNRDMVLTLLEFAADPQAKSDDGKTPADMTEDEDIAALLESAKVTSARRAGR